MGWVAERHPQLIERLHAAGHEIGSHSYLHQKVYELGADAFRHDLTRSLAVVAAASGETVTAYRAPEWSINARAPWALEMLARAGIRVDASMAPVKLVGDTSFPRYPHTRSTPAGPIAEVPPFVADRWGQAMPVGWGWALRMSSPARVLAAIDAANAAGRPAVLTVHPWELDPEPPRVRLPLRLWFAHYFRLEGFARRLRQVVSGAAFGPIREMGPISAEL